MTDDTTDTTDGGSWVFCFLNLVMIIYWQIVSSEFMNNCFTTMFVIIIYNISMRFIDERNINKNCYINSWIML
jgi:hypothetical protein